MSKNKSAGTKSGSKKIPKRIAGVKIPKGLRESGNAAVKLAQSPMARELLTAGLAAAAAAVAANARARKAAGQSGGAASDAFANVAEAATKSAGEIKTALVAAAGVAAQQFFAANAGAEAADTGDATAASETRAPDTGEQEIAPVADAARPRTNGTRRTRVRVAKPSPATTN